MGLTPQECPPVIRGGESDPDKDDDDNVEPDNDNESRTSSQASRGNTISTPRLTNRAVTIPDTVRHYVVPVKDGTSPGKILTSAYSAIQSFMKQSPNNSSNSKRMLLVLTRNFGISTQNAIGALKHFQCQPEPTSLLDALEADGTEAMMEQHRRVTGSSGVGGSSSSSSLTSFLRDGDDTSSNNRYLLVTGEDTIRGLHLDGLDVVLVAGRPVGPDEYTHIAGRTGRAGRSGSVVNIVSDQDADMVVSWERMLGIQYERCENVEWIGLRL